MIRILAQAIDAAVGSQREFALREEVGAAREARQQPADFVEVGVGYAGFLDLASVIDQVSNGLGALLIQSGA